MATEENKATARRFYEEVINQNKLEVADELVAENVVAQFLPPGLPSGLTGLKIFVSVFHGAFPNGHLTIKVRPISPHTSSHFASNLLRRTSQRVLHSRYQRFSILTHQSKQVPALNRYTSGWTGPGLSGAGFS